MTLNINTVFQEDHQVKLTVELEQSLLENAKKRAARQIAKRTRIPGFRPGKAPYQVVLRTVGEGSVVQEAIDILLDDIYPNIIEESEVKPYGPGSLSNIISLEPPTLEFLVPLEPTISSLEYKDIRIPYELEEVNDDDVNQTIEDLRDREALFEVVERAADVGDQVTLRLKADRKEADEENEEIALIQERQTALTVNADDADTKTEWPYSGFSKELKGMSAGEEKTFEYTYPDDAYLEYLRGTEAVFNIKIESVKVRQLPEIDDEFAKKFGEYDSIQALRDEIFQGLSEQRTNDYDRDYENKIIDQILEKAEIKYPPQLLEREIENFKNQLENRLAQQNLDIQAYMQSRQIDEQGLRAELIQPAEERLRRSLVLVELARLEDIKIDEQEVQNQTINTINQIQQMYKPEDTKKILTQEFIQNMVSNISSDLMVQNTLSHLKSIAKGEAEKQEQEESSETSKTEESIESDITVGADASEESMPAEITAQDNSEITPSHEIETDSAETGTTESQTKAQEGSTEEPSKPKATKKRKPRKATE